MAACPTLFIRPHRRDNIGVQIPRFYCPDLSVSEPVLDAAQSRHALRSLRLSEGDLVALFDGRGRVAVGVLVASGGTRTKKHVRVAVESVEALPPPSRTLTLIVAGCKGPRLTWLIEKCTELGATEIWLADFERSVVRVSDRHAQKLRTTAIESCKQCRRAWLPEIRCGVTPDSIIRSAHFDRLAIAHADAAAQSGAEWFAADEPAARIAAVIGPEGGLTDDALVRLVGLGGQIVRLAAHTLRVETAAVAMTALWAGCSANFE